MDAPDVAMMILALIQPSPTPLPVTIVDAVHMLQDERVSVGLLIATIILAAATFLLFLSTLTVARRTAELADDTVEASRWADRHHQESLRPLVVPVGASVAYHEAFTNSNTGEVVKRNLTLGGRETRPDFYKLFGTISVFVKLTNIGPGPALNVTVYVQPVGEALITAHVGHIRTLPDANADPLYFTIMEDEFRSIALRPDFNLGQAIDFSLRITYQTIFSQDAETNCKYVAGKLVGSVEFSPPPLLDRSKLANG